jgi:hypothetical protein
MAIPLTVNGNVYNFPQEGDVGYAGQVTAWAEALTEGALQLGGTYALLSELTFTGFGVDAPYFESGTANPATAGVLRLAKSDSIAWRNNANSGNVLLYHDNTNDDLYSANAAGTVFTQLTGLPCVVATSTAATSCTGSATTDIPYATVAVDTDSAFVGATGIFTVPAGKGGRYLVDASVRITVVTATAVDLIGTVQVNGTPVASNGIGPTTTDATQVRVSLTVNRILNLSAGDTVKFSVINGVATARSLDTQATHNFISIQKMPG